MEVKDIFQTTIGIFDLDLQQVNQEIKHILINEQSFTPDSPRSNVGGWHSPFLQKRSESCFIKLREEISKCFDQFISSKAQKNYSCSWDMVSWAIINNKGDYNIPHSHGDSEWSCAYYIDAGDVNLDENLRSGNLLLIDPRGPVLNSNWSSKYCEGLYEDLFSKSIMSLTPKTGMLIIFPSWLVHSVTPYQGEKPRIVYSANFILIDSKLI